MNKYIKRDNQLTCILSGRIDTLSSSVLENELTEKMKEDISSVVFDMRYVDYISSTFLRIVIKMVKALGKGNFVISNIQPTVMKVFKMANLTDIVKFE